MATSDEGRRYAGKVTIVTGGAQGIGRGCVEVFMQHGSKVVFADIKDDVGQALEEKLSKSGYPGKPVFIKCDVTKADDVKMLVEKTVDVFGQIDCLINNAGYSPGGRTLDTTSVDEYKSILDLNLVAPFHLSKIAIPHLRKTKGNIINIASMSGVLGQGNAISYVSSKAGLIGLTKTMAVDESKYGVRVNSVSPGPIDTPLHRSAMATLPHGDKYFKWFAEHSQFMRRNGQPDEIGKACLFLATDATYTTGHNLHCSAGGELDYGFKADMEPYMIS